MTPLNHQDTDVLRESQAISPAKRRTALMGVKLDRKKAAIFYIYGHRCSSLQGTSK